jgi:twitching motility protein PilT
MDKPDLDHPGPQQLRAWLTRAVEAEASDLHLVSGHPPMLRVHGELRPLDAGPLDGASVRALLVPACPPQAMERFKADRNADFALELPLADRRQRFRANYFVAGKEIGACFRVIPSAIPGFPWAGFPEALAYQLSHFRNGLVLICGVVGSGKTTSLAMMVNLLNREGGYRIITVEEPVEYLFP